MTAPTRMRSSRLTDRGLSFRSCILIRILPSPQPRAVQYDNPRMIGREHMGARLVVEPVQGLSERTGATADLLPCTALARATGIDHQHLSVDHTVAVG